jgi:2'-5' RNA ligase
MPNLTAIDVAILPPDDVSQRAITLNAALPAVEGKGLRLDADHLPHITLVQQFVRVEDIDVAANRIEEVLRHTPPLPIRIIGAGQSGTTVWLTADRTAQLVALHEQLMHALQGLSRRGGTARAFAEDARPGDVVWVTTYRTKAAFRSFAPHITLGHAKQPPPVEPFGFDATTVALCQLGRFCTCRRVLRQWTLSAPVPDSRRPTE